MKLPTPTLTLLAFAAITAPMGTTARAQTQTAAAASAATAATDDSVYRAWGGEAAIRAVMEDFVPRLEAHPRIGKFFDKNGRKRLVKLLTEQLCEVSGGPCVYSGAPMNLAHQGMGVKRADFNALVEVLQASMNAKGIPFRAQNAMLARLAPMHREIVETPE